MKYEKKFVGRVSDGKLTLSDGYNFDQHLRTLEGDVYVVVDKFKQTRTQKQNRALHLYFTLLADKLNDAGFDMKAVIRDDVDIGCYKYSSLNNNEHKTYHYQSRDFIPVFNYIRYVFNQIFT